MSLWDGHRGWNETNAPADISTEQNLVTGFADRTIIVRRVRGSAGGAFELRSRRGGAGTGVKIADFPDGEIDVPGLEIQTRLGHTLSIIGAGLTSARVAVQWSYKQKAKQGGI